MFLPVNDFTFYSLSHALALCKLFPWNPILPCMLKTDWLSAFWLVLILLSRNSSGLTTVLPVPPRGWRRVLLTCSVCCVTLGSPDRLWMTSWFGDSVEVPQGMSGGSIQQSLPLTHPRTYSRIVISIVGNLSQSQLEVCRSAHQQAGMERGSTRWFVHKYKDVAICC